MVDLRPTIQGNDGLEFEVRYCVGGVLSPTLANVFLHHAFDSWMAVELPHIRFERYCDDVIVHCASERQARYLRDRIARRLAGWKLKLNDAKTSIVYCKDDDRRGSYPRRRFDFLGYTFRPRLSKSRFGKHFVNFTPAVSDEAAKAIRQEIRRWHLHRRSDKTLGDLARMFNPIVQGWINFYGPTSPGCIRLSGRSTSTWSVGPWGSIGGCAAGSGGRGSGWRASPGVSPISSPTGGSACGREAGQWEPDEPRGSRRVLREPGGEISPGHSPGLLEKASNEGTSRNDGIGGGFPTASRRERRGRPD